jgi:Lon-like protease
VTPTPTVLQGRPRLARTLMVVGVILSLLATSVLAAVVVASRVTVPYYALRPGSLRDGQVEIEVVGAPVREADGRLYYTTVSVREVSALEFVTSSFDANVDLVHEDDILGDRDPEENREFNLQLMDDAQERATALALEVLGYEVEDTLQGYMVHQTLEGFASEGVLERGDVITEVGGVEIDGFDALETALSDAEPGDEVDLLVESRPEALDAEAEDEECGARLAESAEADVEPESRTLELGVDPEDRDRAIMGVMVGPHYDFPVEICFDTGDVGGPSAGLAFTLTLINMLSSGDLTGGLDVAVTGSIDLEGNVGPVGGTPQKMVAARREGVDVFLVPSTTESEDLERVRNRAGDVQVIEVATLDDAVEALVELGGDPPDDLRDEGDPDDRSGRDLSGDLGDPDDREP